MLVFTTIYFLVVSDVSINNIYAFIVVTTLQGCNLVIFFPTISIEFRTVLYESLKKIIFMLLIVGDVP
jgi:hypothetical protein